MKDAEALQIVIDLATDNTLSENECLGDIALLAECNRQLEALERIVDLLAFLQRKR